MSGPLGRQKEAVERAGSLCVTAGAGTGKTFVLVNRYLGMIAPDGENGSAGRDGIGNGGVGGILALTYTEKAAAEMKARIRAAVADKAGEEWEQVAEDLLFAHISTIHAFCSGILREFALEAGVEPGFVPLEEHELERILAQSVTDLFHTDPPEGVRGPLMSLLRAMGDRPLEAALRELYGRRHLAEPFFDRLSRDRDGVIRTWMAELVTEQERIRDMACAAGAAEAAAVLADLADRYAGESDAAAKYLKEVAPILRDICTDAPPTAFCAAMAEFAGVKGRANMGSKKTLGEDKERLGTAFTSLRAVAQAVPTDLCMVTIGQEEPATLAACDALGDLATVYHRFSALIEAAKRASGAIDFTDMIVLTARFLERHPEISRDHLRGRYRYIMVDEYQDTDPLQASIIRTILGAEGAAGSLFVVGDPKQSIYLFRNADVTQFRRTMEEIEGAGGATVALDINFRSTPAVVGIVNAVFSRLFASDRLPWEFRYDPITPSEGREEHHGSVDLLLTPPAKGPAAFRDEATMVARSLQEIVTRQTKPVYRKRKELDGYDPATGDGDERVPAPPRWQDCAVLIESRTNLEYLEDAFGRYGIPFHVHRGTGFYRRQEVRDFGSLLTFLARPDDDLALYGVLRSPWFGFSDAALYRAAGGNGRGLFGRLRRSGEGKAVFAAALLNRWLAYARREPLNRLISRITDESGIRAVYAALDGGDQMAANLGKIAAMIRERGQAAIYTLDDCARDFADAIASGRDEEEAPVEGSVRDAVTVMTVHASKGLQFPIVVLPWMARSRTAPPPGVLVDEECGIGMKVPDGDGILSDTPVRLLIDHRLGQKVKAERKRLFYVAMTRAEDHLILSGMRPAADAVPAVETGTSRMDWFCAALGMGEDAIAAGEIGYTDACGTPSRVRVITDPAAITAQERRTVPTMPEPGSLGTSARRDAFARPPWSDAPPAGARRPVTVSRLEKGDTSAKPVPRLFSAPDAGMPASAGIILHEVMAGVPAETALFRAGQTGSPEHIRRLEAAREAFFSLPLVRDATAHRCEVPFSVDIEGRHCTGRIDRLIRTADGRWAVIDYKSGSWHEGTDAAYSCQMAMYREAAILLTGDTEPDCYLWFAGNGRLVKVNPGKEELYAAIHRYTD
ncbi:hypothetical protein AZH53_08985 [Methanomicrobiaceae archaeon CYW5]|uniref:UvrD-helicase domain-containing protein n=1 Tax=Methanovulcanius yangii TaxID=1789227 RepID=UPI0029CA2CC9|nr:UvrD-helicase domain-containing protein [Methanovulcanius yangii]MBT8508538.1 hypothetical protein [Methanovulcanius yangii]